MQEINVEKIMSEIRRGIEEQGLREEEIEFALSINGRNGEKGWNYGAENVYSVQIMEENSQYINNHHNNPIFFPLQGSSFKVMVQKIIRKFTRFIIFGPFQYQNSFNLAVSRCIEQINCYINEQERDKQQILDLQKQLSKQQEMIEELKKAIEDMGKEI